MMEHKMWVVEMKGDQFAFTKFVDGREVATHGLMDKAAASVFAVSIIQGFQPPALFAEVEGE
ncbi:TPA: hypothetical protein ACSTLU_002888 [Serratia fonticola]|uniref:hypothetical protein n=1 Tax=Serratia fonticola TaxID=47917 RepID=UPI0021BDD8F4|nr:hypothetical protein [Serratia fonticola]